MGVQPVGNEYPKFSCWFRVKLAEQGWKQADLKREFELRGEYMSSATTSKWAKGTVQPTRKNCALLASIFDVPVLHVLHLAEHEALEDYGPFAEIANRLYQLPAADREEIVRRVVEYGNKMLDDLE
jgi:hypothetical protein